MDEDKGNEELRPLTEQELALASGGEDTVMW